MLLNSIMYNAEYCKETDDRLILAVTTLFDSNSSAIAKKASRVLLKIILNWSESPMQRVDVKNGACLCARCHAEEHKNESVYGLMKSRLVVI